MCWRAAACRRHFRLRRSTANDFWDGGIIDNTPLGDAIDAFSGSDDVDRILIVMNLFRKERAAPKNMIDVNDRLAELRYGNRLRQDRQNAHTVNELLQTIEELAALRSPRFDGSTARGACDLALADSRCSTQSPTSIWPIPIWLAEAGLSPRSEESGGFRDFSKTGIERRRDSRIPNCPTEAARVVRNTRPAAGAPLIRKFPCRPKSNVPSMPTCSGPPPATRCGWPIPISSSRSRRISPPMARR